MGKRIIYIILVLIFSFLKNTFSQVITEEQVDNFINSLLNDSFSENISVEEDNLNLSKRLGIKYDEVENKFLIAYNIEKKLRSEIRNGKYDYITKIEKIDENFSKVIFEVPDVKYSQEFYFEKNKLISPISYQIKNWKSIETKYFRIWISEPALFNKYSAKQLDNFVDSMTNKLQMTREEKEILEKEKIYYVFCKDDSEIQKLTGFKTIGIYNLACDYIVSTYNCHFHEICHLLMNYKLKQVPLYTHPFFQEGFAVGFGGRGGRSPQVIRKVGEYLLKSKIVELSELFTKDGFNSEDASITYPVVGFYNYYLFQEIGIEKYIKLYRKYSSGESNINNVVIIFNDLLDFTKFKEFSSVSFPEANLLNFDDNKDYFIYDIGNNYLIKMKDTMLITTGDCEPDYKSKKFEEMVKSRKYKDEKYLILINESEILIYELYTNILIANYVSSFEIPAAGVPKKNDYFYFIISKKYFDEDITKAYLNN